MARMFTKPVLRVVAAFLVDLGAGLALLILATKDPIILTFDAIGVIFCLLASIKLEALLEE